MGGLIGGGSNSGGGNPFSAIGGALSNFAQGSGTGSQPQGASPQIPPQSQQPESVLTDPTTVAASAVGQGPSAGSGQQPQTPPSQGFTSAPTGEQHPLSLGWMAGQTQYAQGQPGQQPPFWQGTPGVDPTQSSGIAPGQMPQPSGIDPSTSTGLPAGMAGNVVGQEAQAPVAQAPVTPPAPPPEPTPTATEAQTRKIGRQRRQGAAPASSAPPGEPPDVHTGNPIQDLINIIFGGLNPGLRGVNRQVGGDYGSQGYTQHGYGYGETPPPSPMDDPNRRVTARPGQLLPRTTMEQARRDRLAGQDMPPGSAGRAVIAGFDRAAAQEGRPPGTTPASAAPSADSQQSEDFIRQRGGYSETGYGQKRGEYGAYKFDPQFSSRLAAAGQEFERTHPGQKANYGLGDRDPETQRFFWDDSRHGTRYAAAAPGKSLHQKGDAMDMPEGAFRQWLQQGNAQKFGLGFPVPHDANHIQMVNLRGVAYPYSPASDVQAHFAGAAPGESVPRPPGSIPNYTQDLFQIESGGNRYATTGSNRGLGQFGPAEERQFGITAANRADPNAQAAAVQREVAAQRPILQRALGREPQPWELYFTHQQGQAGGPALLRADPNTPAWQVLRPYYRDAATAQRAVIGNLPRNDPLRAQGSNITAGQFRQWWQNRFNRGYHGADPTQMSQAAPQQPIRLAGDVPFDPSLLQLASAQSNSIMAPRLKSKEQRRMELDRAEGGRSREHRRRDYRGYEPITDPSGDVGDERYITGGGLRG